MVHGMLVIDEVGLRGGCRSGVETWTERLSWTEHQSVTHTESGSACCSLKSCVLFYVCRATEEFCVEQLKEVRNLKRLFYLLRV